MARAVVLIRVGVAVARDRRPVLDRRGRGVVAAGARVRDDVPPSPEGEPGFLPGLGVRAEPPQWPAGVFAPLRDDAALPGAPAGGLGEGHLVQCPSADLGAAGPPPDRARLARCRAGLEP